LSPQSQPLSHKLAYIALGCLFLMLTSFNINMENFTEFHVYPDDVNDQLKVTWTPKQGAIAKMYYLEKSRDNDHFEVWKKSKGEQINAQQRCFEIDFEPSGGWSYYRIRETTQSGQTNTTPAIPVFLGLEILQKAVRIMPETLVKDRRQKVSLSNFDGKSFILVLQDENGDEYLYDRPIRATEAGFYIEPGSGLPKGQYKIKASSLEKLIGMTILVY
jgi:hypothetical protein